MEACLMRSLHRSVVFTSLLAITLLLADCARSADHVPAGNLQNGAAADSVESIRSGGVTRQYRLHVPASYERGRLIPLVINLHGYNSNAKQQEEVSRMSIKADAAGFVVAYPEGLGDPQSWKFGSGAEGQADVAFI